MIQRHIITSVLITFVTTVLLGIAYPLIVTEIAQLLFPEQAMGSLIKSEDERIVGSKLLGQPFSSPGYFRGRPSAVGVAGYDASSSTGSNLGPTNSKLFERIDKDLEQLRKENPNMPIPIDLVTASGSGLDPHISPAAAEFQIPRVARERGVSEQEIRKLVGRHTEGRQFGLLGEPRVNVLELNLELDKLYPMKH